MEILQKDKIIGKTYSLYNGKDSTDCFFEELTNVTNDILSRCNSEVERLKLIRDSSTGKRRLQKESRSNPEKSLPK